jgi:hypothetical protein
VSADNFVGVRPNGNGTYAIFEYGNMSVYGEDCMYLLEVAPTVQAPNRAEALVAAHDMVNAMDICEYGVVEMSAASTDPCGRCYVCIHQRGIVADDTTKCDDCGEAIAYGEWQVGTQGKTYHSRCDPTKIRQTI